MKLEVRDLRMIEAIAMHGTMTRAAAELHVSQSALSHQLTELESMLGVQLFQRRPRSSQPIDCRFRARGKAPVSKEVSPIGRPSVLMSRKPPITRTEPERPALSRPSKARSTTAGTGKSYMCLPEPIASITHS